MFMFIRELEDISVPQAPWGESYNGRIQQPHMEDIVGNYSTVVETLIQAMQYVHRKSRSVHLSPNEHEGWMNARKQALG